MINDCYVQCLARRLHFRHSNVCRKCTNSRITNCQPKISWSDVEGRQRLTLSACMLANVVNEFTRSTCQRLG